MSNTLKALARSFDAHPQTPAHGLLGHRLPKLALDRRTDVSSAHGAVSRRQHVDDRSLYDAVAELPRSWLQLRFGRPGLDATLASPEWIEALETGSRAVLPSAFSGEEVALLEPGSGRAARHAERSPNRASGDPRSSNDARVGLRDRRARLQRSCR